jgi:hypothetical protein
VPKERKELQVSLDQHRKTQKKTKLFFSTDIPNPEENKQSDSESTSETSDSDSSSDSSESENENTEGYLDSLLQKALQKANAAERRSNGGEDPDEEDVIVLEENILRYTNFTKIEVIVCVEYHLVRSPL